jgi:FkbM family methyltransferase
MLRNVALKLPRLRRLIEERNSLRAERHRLASALAAQNAELQTDSPFLHHNEIFDPQEVVRRHALPGARGTPGYPTNFLGVRIDPKFFPTILEGRAGEVECIPIPANWHADVAEWGAALRAVDLAYESFTVVELGCGSGCWINNTGVAARRAGLDVHLIGIEGDAGHLKFADEAYAANGFAMQQVTLHHGIAASGNGVALFPRQQHPGKDWGLEPIFDATEQQRHDAAQSGSHYQLPMIALDDIIAAYQRVDLLHIDIQGGEVDLITGCLPVINDKVGYLVVGTHSRQIEGRLMDTLLETGWRMEIERPAIMSLSGTAPR